MELKKNFRPEYWHIPTIVSDHPQIQAFDEKVYAVIHWFYNMKDGKCTASNQRLAETIKPSGPQVRSVQNSLNHLEDYGFIQRKYKDNSKRHRTEIIPLVRYRLVRTTDDTKDSNEPQMIPERTTDDTQNEPQMTRTIRDSNKINNTNVATRSVAGKEIQELIDLFEPINPSYSRMFRNKTERAAAGRLIGKYGFEKISAFVKTLPIVLSRPYAPRVSSPYQLERKLGELKQFIAQEKNKNQSIRKSVTI